MRDTVECPGSSGAGQMGGCGKGIMDVQEYQRLIQITKKITSEIAGKYPCSQEHVASVLEQYDYDREKAEKHLMLELTTGGFI